MSKGDTVLNLRLVMPVNGFRAALGRVGYDEKDIIPNDKLVKHECQKWNSSLSWKDYITGLGHSYHYCEKACDYYLKHM